MGFSLVNNLASLDSQSRLSATSARLNRTLQRLSSGLRINNSGDDAAGLAIANAFRNDIAKLSQGIRNANDGVSTLQIIDGGLATISTLLDRAMTLATQSASDTFIGGRSTLNAELGKVVAEISRQAQNIGLASADPDPARAAWSRFAKSLTVFIGGGTSANSSNNSVMVDLSSVNVDAAGLGFATYDSATGNYTVSIDISTQANALTAIQTIRSAVTTLGGVQGKVGAGQNNLAQAIDLATSQLTNFQAAESRIRDADVASEASDLSRLTILQQAGVAALAQANQSNQAVLSLLR